MNKTGAFRVERFTERGPYVAPDIRYYVKEDFQKVYGANKAKMRAVSHASPVALTPLSQSEAGLTPTWLQVEERVHQTYEYQLARQCEFEEHERRRLIYAARSQSTREAQEREMEKAIPSQVLSGLPNTFVPSPVTATTAGCFILRSAVIA